MLGASDLLLAAGSERMTTVEERAETRQEVIQRAAQYGARKGSGGALCGERKAEFPRVFSWHMSFVNLSRY